MHPEALPSFDSGSSLQQLRSSWVPFDSSSLKKCDGRTDQRTDCLEREFHFEKRSLTFFQLVSMYGFPRWKWWQESWVRSLYAHWQVYTLQENTFSSTENFLTNQLLLWPEPELPSKSTTCCALLMPFFHKLWPPFIPQIVKVMLRKSRFLLWSVSSSTFWVLRVVGCVCKFESPKDTKLVSHSN